jgi:hypothetical protein
MVSRWWWMSRGGYVLCALALGIGLRVVPAERRLCVVLFQDNLGSRGITCHDFV